MGPSSSGSQSSPWSGIGLRQGETLFSQADPTLSTLFQQIQQALQTGGVGAQVPVIQNAVTNMRNATNQSLNNAKTQLGAVGAGTDPVSQGQFANIAMQGNQQVADIPTQIAQQFISMGANLAPSVATNGANITNTASSQNVNTTGQQSFDWGSLLSSLIPQSSFNFVPSSLSNGGSTSSSGGSSGSSGGSSSSFDWSSLIGAGAAAASWLW